MTTTCEPTMRRYGLILLLAALACAACAEPGGEPAAPFTASPADAGSPAPFRVGGLRYSSDGFVEWLLPGALRELSGFTTDAAGRLFGHDDERAVIHQIDYAQGGIIKSFGLGSPPVRGDFEGITLIDDTFALTTSDGVLYIAPEGAHRERVGFHQVDTGLGTRCEIEGVEYDAPERLLWFACKTPRTPALENRLTVIAWSLDDMAEVPERTLSIDRTRLRESLGKSRVRPTGIAISPATGDLVLVASRINALITLSKDGQRLAALRLPDSQSLRQLEAVAFGAAGELILGSEGQQERGRMRVYRVAD